MYTPPLLNIPVKLVTRSNHDLSVPVILPTFFSNWTVGEYVHCELYVSTQYPIPLIDDIVLSADYYTPNVSSHIILKGTVDTDIYTDFIFNDNDKVRKQTATDITFIFGEPIPPDCSPIRNGNDNNFDCRCAPLISDSNNFNVICDYGNVDFGFIESYYGDSVQAEFIRTSTATIADGTTTSTLIDFRIQKDVKPVIQYGENTSAQVSYNYLFNPSIGFGSSLRSHIDYRPQYNISSNVYSGDNFTSPISRIAGLAPSISYGESFAFNITPQYSVYYDATVFEGTNAYIDIATFPSTDVTVSVYYGELLDYNVSLTSSIETNAQYGDNIIATVNTHTIFVPTVSVGEHVSSNVEYISPVDLDFIAHAGDVVESNIASSTILKPTISFGENALLNLKYYISTGSEFSGYVGEVFNADITTYAYIKSNTYIGHVVSTEMDIRPPTSLSVDLYSGESVITDTAITTTYSATATYGDVFKIPYISTAENTYLYYGDNVTTELASQTSFNNNKMYYGENVVGSIKYAPSEPLGTFDFYTGTSLYHDIQTEISTYFKPKFSFNIEFEQTIWDSTYVDLNRYDCCPPKVEDLLHVNLQRDKEVEVRYDIPHQFAVTTDLVAAPILYPNISHGTTMSIDEYDMLLSANFRYGENVDVLDLYNDIIVDLNSGNPELDDDNVLIETSKDYTEFQNSFATIGDGTQVSSELSISHGLVAEMAFGLRTSTFNFVTESAWRMHFYGFAGMRTTLNTNIKLGGRMFIGTELRTQFYEIPIHMQSGENVSCHIIVEYDVEFIDDGCLDNGHIPTTSEGIPIIDDTNEMAIEGQYYSRYIRGRCF